MKILEAFNQLLFPPFCLYCHKSLDKPFLYCSCCLEQIQLASPVDRCLKCFSYHCDGCNSKFYYLYLFDPEGPITALLSRLKNGSLFPFMDLIASYALWQIEICNWPTFDWVIPASFSAHSRQLAKACASMHIGKYRYTRALMGNVLYVDITAKNAKTLEKKEEKSYFLSIME